MRFKVGDRVKVLNDLEVDKMYGGDYVIPEMVEWLGKIATISIVGSNYYNLDIDGGEWCWTDEMLEEETKMEDKKYIKFDIPEWVNWLARDNNGALYGYRNKPVECFDMWGVTGDSNDFEEVVVSFITDDLEYYPHVKWNDEEPTAFKDGITVTDIEVLGEDVSDDTTEPDMVNTPPHYKQYSFEPIDIITEVVKEYPPEIGFHIGTALKYLFRGPFKGKQQEDLAKAEYYLQRANKELGE